MSKINTKATINANVKQNGVQTITGQILNSVLNAMVDDYGTQEDMTAVQTAISTLATKTEVSTALAAQDAKLTELEGLISEVGVVIKNYSSSATIESGKRVNSSIRIEVASSGYKINRMFLPSGRYRVISTMLSAGCIPFSEWDSGYTASVRAVMGNGETDKIVELTEGYYIVCWDSGYGLDYAQVLNLDNIDVNPTENSTNLVESGGVYKKIKESVASKLKGKKIVWEGDSICADNEWDNTGWRTRIQEATGAIGVNYSVGGSLISYMEYDGGVYPCINDRIGNDIVANRDANYFIFDGGTNDADRIGRIVKWYDDAHTKIEYLNGKPNGFGEWNETNFNGTYSYRTFCGGLEKIIYTILRYARGAKVGYIIPPKMGDQTSLTFYNRKAYFETAKAICKKWGIPVLDLWEETWMNPNLPNQWDGTTNKQANVNAGNYYLDGQHPTPVAYDYLSPIIQKWIESL